MRVTVQLELSLDPRKINPDQVENYVRKRTEKAIRDGVLFEHDAVEIREWIMTTWGSIVTEAEILQVKDTLMHHDHPDNVSYYLDDVVKGTFEAEALGVNSGGVNDQLEHLASVSKDMEAFLNLVGISDVDVEAFEEDRKDDAAKADKGPEVPEVQLHEGTD